MTRQQFIEAVEKDANQYFYHNTMRVADAYDTDTKHTTLAAIVCIKERKDTELAYRIYHHYEVMFNVGAVTRNTYDEAVDEFLKTLR